MLMQWSADSALSPDEVIAESLLSEGWAVTDNFVSGRTVDELAREVELLDEHGRLQPATMGRGESRQSDETRRGDRISWLDPAGCPAVIHRYFHRMDELRIAINRELMSGLFELEAHAALYDAGKFYEKHLDCFQDDDSRLVTSVLYLNQKWRKEDGGELRLYLNTSDESDYVDIEPIAGRLVTFLSSDFPHEVLPAHRRRLSLTGWFRRRSIS